MTKPVTPHLAVSEVTLTKIVIEVPTQWSAELRRWVAIGSANLTCYGRAGTGEMIAYNEDVVRDAIQLSADAQEAVELLQAEMEGELAAQVEANIKSE